METEVISIIMCTHKNIKPEDGKEITKIYLSPASLFRTRLKKHLSSLFTSKTSTCLHTIAKRVSERNWLVGMDTYVGGLHGQVRSKRNTCALYFVSFISLFTSSCFRK